MPETLLEVRVVLFSLNEAALQVFLIRQAEAAWALPGCPARKNESLEETALRALYGEFERNQIYLEQLYTYGGPARAVSVVYFALVPHNQRRAAELRQHRVDALPALAGDHAEIITYALRRLRYKLEYSAAGFELLPAEFTLTELQRTYEIILGEKLDKRNFRRRILAAKIIEETPRLRGGEGRPARLYRYRPDAVAEVKTRRLFP